jgi:hypothetical protein
MPPAKVLLIDVRADGVFLFGYTTTGEFAGDTWHRTVREAKEQARFEHGDRVSPWQAIPESVEDPVALALAEADAQLDRLP